MKPVRFSLNGETVEALVEPRTSLADFLREQQRLTGTHLGCEHGVCGCCTVLIDGKPARSCITYTVQCADVEIRTIEGFDDDPVMRELRAAFTREHALQCGFCTPGMLVSARDVVLRVPGANERRIREEMSGNLCRCTGYAGIVRAILSVVQSRAQSEAQPQPEKASAAMSVAPAAAPVLVAETHAAITGGTRIEEEFVLHHRLSKVWAAFADMPGVAACLPGAEIAEASPTAIKGVIRVRFGPMHAAFAGSATLERDEAAHRGVIRGAGKDNLSSSRARGDIAYRLSETGDSTRIAVSIDYSLQGSLAQFSRGGLVRELVGRMASDFAANLDRRLASGGAAVPAPAQVDAGEVFWKWLRSRIAGLFGKRSGV